jgi:serine/threonine protein kinase
MTGLMTTRPGTAQGTILGTLHYMAPEQVEGREADARSDIWALGGVAAMSLADANFSCTAGRTLSSSAGASGIGIAP